MTNHSKYEPITLMIRLQCKIRKLEQTANIIKRLRRVRNEILSNCAYHDKNSSEQMERLKKLNAPQNEIDLINRCGFISFELSQGMLKEYNVILDSLENGFNVKERKLENETSEENLDKEYWERLRKIRNMKNDDKN